MRRSSLPTYQKGRIGSTLIIDASCSDDEITDHRDLKPLNEAPTTNKRIIKLSVTDHWDGQQCFIPTMTPRPWARFFHALKQDQLSLSSE